MSGSIRFFFTEASPAAEVSMSGSPARRSVRGGVVADITLQQKQNGSAPAAAPCMHVGLSNTGSVQLHQGL